MPQSQFPFLDWFNEQPEVGYFAALGQAGGNPALQRYFQSLYGSTYNQYLGALGQQAMSGQDPNMLFTDWLKQNPFTTRYARLSPLERGETQGRFNPFARWGI